MFGFLLQWPTILTVIKFPILVIAYPRLARHEERLARQKFGRAYLDYMRLTSAWIPKFFQPTVLTSKQIKMNTITKAILISTVLTLPALSGNAYSHQQDSNGSGMMTDPQMMGPEMMNMRMNTMQMMMEQKMEPQDQAD